MCGYVFFMFYFFLSREKKKFYDCYVLPCLHFYFIIIIPKSQTYIRRGCNVMLLGILDEEKKEKLNHLNKNLMRYFSKKKNCNNNKM
jgi:hypothetical protein